MHLKGSACVVSALGLLFGVAACDQDLPQVVTGTLHTTEGAWANQSLRLYASHPACDGAFVETRTDGNGAFRFATETTKGGLSVVTQSIALCIQKSGAWVPLWATIIGGGAKSMTLTCRPRTGNDPFVEFCEVNADYGA